MVLSLSKKKANMNSIYNAYQAYERRVTRGEFVTTLRTAGKSSTPPEPLLARVGDLLIHTGLKLKRRYATGKAMAWSPMTGSKQ